MINDYIWTQLYAQREAELRARARRHGGDAASPRGRRPGPLGWLPLRLGRRPVRAQQTGGATTATPGEVRALPAHGAGTRPATPQPTVSTKDAA